MKPITRSKREATWRKSDGHCWYCGTRLDPFNFHVDHFIPLCKGGGHEIENLVPSCKTCNMKKNGRDAETLRRSISTPAACRLTETQIAWLETMGVDLTLYHQSINGYKFHFEIWGLTR